MPIAAIVVWGLLALPGADRADGFPATAARVTIKSMAFEPRVIYIAAGEIVHWVNADVGNAAHTQRQLDVYGEVLSAFSHLTPIRK